MSIPSQVVCIGEALVDFLPDAVGVPVERVERWTPCPGGSPANVAVGLARLGARAAMVGTVGNDPFGSFLIQRLEAEGVDIGRLRATGEGRTGLVFISLTTQGERTFAFYRTRSAELFLSPEDVAGLAWGDGRALHCGSNSLLWDGARQAVGRAVSEARAAGSIVSCDPNLRLHMWPEPQALRELLDGLLPQCTIVKLAEDETEFVTGQRDPDRALDVLLRRGVALPIVTLGARGARFAWKTERICVEAPRAALVDSTGAGDGFVAGLLFELTRRFSNERALLGATAGDLERSVRFACAVGARVVQSLGAVAGLPRWDEARFWLDPKA